jgi:hypothetical protein
VTILSKSPPKDGKKRKPQRRPPFITRQALHEIGEVLRAEGAGRAVPEEQVTLEALLAIERSGTADPSSEK